MHCSLVALVCLAVVVPSALALNCCIPELVEKIKANCVTGVLEQEKAFALYNGCILSDTDAARFTSVYGAFHNETLGVTVNRIVEPLGLVSREYTFQDNGDCTYEQIDLDSGEPITVYSIYTSEHYTAKYGCKNNGKCEDGSNFVQCAFPPGTDRKYYKECQEKLDAVVKGYINTKNIC